MSEKMYKLKLSAKQKFVRLQPVVQESMNPRQKRKLRGREGNRSVCSGINKRFNAKKMVRTMIVKMEQI